MSRRVCSSFTVHDKPGEFGRVLGEISFAAVESLCECVLSGVRLFFHCISGAEKVQAYSDGSQQPCG